jgi:hypothetical protein
MAKGVAMSDEQRVILQMVSEGKITADDGVKLLEALGKGQEKRREKDAPADKSKRRSFLLRTAGDQIPDIGHMVRAVVHDAISGIGVEMNEPDTDFCEVEGEGGHPMGEALELPEGTELVLRPFLCMPGGGGDVFLRGVRGSTCRLTSEDPPDVRVYRDESTVWLKWKEGDLKLEVPQTVARTTVDIMGGDMIVDGLLSMVRLRSKGGEITINRASRGFDAKTMGGNMRVTLAGDWDEDSRLSTMGGDISIGLAEDLAATISARSFGGDVSVQEGIGEVSESGRPGSSHLRLVVGAGEDRPDLRIKTMGGDIRIARTDDAEEQEDEGDREDE